MHKAILFNKLDDSKVACMLCNHYCVIADGNFGTCKLRENVGGELYTSTWGASTGFAIDPIEKKPFYHFKPGSKVLSFGTNGCNFFCRNCQNWLMSQSRDKDIQKTAAFTPEKIAKMALDDPVDGIAYTYSEPTIFFEYARDTILTCRRNPKLEHLSHVFVSNGFFSKEMLDIIEEEKLINAINIDLKFMSDEKYKRICGASLEPVLDSIRRLATMPEILMEVINLVIPGENDSDEDIHRIVDFMHSVSSEIPLHFSRFHPQYKMQDKEPTDLLVLIKAKEIALSTGLKYVYIGNTQIENAENTYCPNCGKLLIERSGFGIVNKCLNGKYYGIATCPNCDYNINLVL